MAKRRQPKAKKALRPEPEAVRGGKKRKKEQTEAKKLLEILEMYDWGETDTSPVEGEDAQRIRRLKDRSEVEAYLNEYGRWLAQESGRGVIFREGNGKIISAEVYVPCAKLTVEEYTEEEYRTRSCIGSLHFLTSERPGITPETT